MQTEQNTPNALTLMTVEYTKQSELIAALFLRIADLEDNCSSLRRELMEQETPEDETPAEVVAPVAVVAPAAVVALVAVVAPVAVVPPVAENKPETELPGSCTIWNERCGAAIAACTTVKNDKEKRAIVAEFKRATQSIAANPTSVVDIWAHFMQYVDNTKETVRVKKMNQINTVMRELGFAKSGAFETVLTIRRAEVDAKKKCANMSLADIHKKFMCADGSLLTSEKLQNLVKSELEKFKTGDITSASARALMCLAFCSYHGQRGEDLCSARYGKQNFTEGDPAYYCPDTHVLHMFAGKTRKPGTHVFFKVHPCVAEAIRVYHTAVLSEQNLEFVLPLYPSYREATTNELRRVLHNSYFAEENAYGLPVKVNPCDLRHLYELHIRHVLKLPKTELDVIMAHIGHSDKTSVQYYSELYKNILSV